MDDIVISSTFKINKNIIEKVESIIRIHGYKIQKKKIKKYNVNEYKKVTGNIISKDGKKLVISNKVRYSILKVKRNKLINKEKKNFIWI